MWHSKAMVDFSAAVKKQNSTAVLFVAAVGNWLLYL
jgi:hypothetical protein